jgi:hypothetical protein
MFVFLLNRVLHIKYKWEIVKNVKTYKIKNPIVGAILCNVHSYNFFNVHKSEIL